MLSFTESSRAIQMRTGKIDLSAFLHAQKGAWCTCGWRKQDVKHVVMFCPGRDESCREMLKAAKTIDHETILTINVDLKAYRQVADE